MRSLISVLSFIILFSGPAFAATPDKDCEAKPWPFARGETRRDRMQIFSRIGREDLVKYYFSEVTKMKDLPLVQDMSTYLIETELDDGRKELYQSIVWATDPFERDGGAKPMPLKMICEGLKKSKKRESE